MTISDEAVEAAAVAMWEQRPMMRDNYGAPIPFHEAKTYQRERFLSQALAALEAAAPHLMAEDGMGHDEVCRDLNRVRSVRDSAEQGSPVWLLNQGMAIAYESVLGVTEDFNPYRSAVAGE